MHIIKKLFHISLLLFLFALSSIDSKAQKNNIKTKQVFKNLHDDLNIIKSSNTLDLFQKKSIPPFLINSEFLLNNKKSINDSKVFRWRNFIIPTTLIAYGGISKITPLLSDFDNNTQKIASQNFHRQYRVDDYIQYLPIAGSYLFYFTGFKAQHNLKDRLILGGTSLVFLATIVTSLKYSTQVLRPDGSTYNSFPSGHTSTAFLGAHLLFKEYRTTSPWIGIGGYIVATTTGVFRIINKRHWLSDTIAGAGVGILSVELGYLMLPIIHKALNKRCSEKPILTTSLTL